MVSIVKPIIYRTTQSTLFNCCLQLLENAEENRGNLLRVLTYHRVDELGKNDNLHPGMISATPAEFARQIKQISKTYHVLSMNTVLDAIEKQTPLPARSVLITFDDAYRDFAKHAWPILKEQKLPVTLFVPTAFPDQPQHVFWWDRLYAALTHANNSAEITIENHCYLLNTPQAINFSFKKIRNVIKSLPHQQAMLEIDRICVELNSPTVSNSVLGWDELRQLAKEGVTLAPHTQTHPLLNRLDLETAMKESTGSLNDLRREIGEALPVIAYPAGGVNNRVAERLCNEGFKLAFTTRRGLNNLDRADRFQLRRINVGKGTSLPIFRTQLLRQFRWFNNCWS
ncbi:hypothetical protein MNBD_PLANCTO02-1133 [hydrothermal vent metagenome]|uniref:NodB homology domain-containing protein n=1 Tax=hydrothermal vent metagenome TaxID=652676 RepID=A0A3B1DZ35_9ZZZZ